MQYEAMVAKHLRPVRHLVHDEIEEWQDTRLRIRIWRAKDAISVVLVSQVPGGRNPAPCCRKLANYINVVYLGHSEDGFTYFEDSICHGVRYLTQLAFKRAGSAMRTHYYGPTPHARRWELLTDALGEPDLER